MNTVYKRPQYTSDINSHQIKQNALFKAICDKRWKESRKLLLRSDKLTLVKYTSFGSSTLHRACLANAPIDVVRSLCRIYQPIVTKRDLERKTALHHACCTASEEVVEFLISEAVHTVAISSADGRLPLHEAILGTRSSSLIVRLLEVWPTAVRKADNHGYTPLQDFLIKWRIMIEWIYLESTNLPNSEGNISGVETFKDILSIMLMAHIHGTVKDHDSLGYDTWLLNHETMRQKTAVPIPATLCQVLLDATTCEESAQQDKRGNFLLHIACT